MGEVGRPSGLTKRRGSSSWYFRMRCPAHLLAQSARDEFWKSLETADYAIALTRIETARVEALRSFQPAPSGILRTHVRAKRPTDPRLPLLRAEDAARLAIDFFHYQIRELDALAPTGWDDGDNQKALRQELAHRLAILRSPEGLGDEEHPALAAETLLLQQRRLRAPPSDHPSRLLREYLRRALLQLVAIEGSRLDGDYSTVVTDPLFAPPLASSVQTSAATRPGITVGDAADRFLAERITGLRNPKTRDRYTREISHMVSFFGKETLLADIRRQQCIEFRDAFALLPPNFGKRQADGVNLRQFIDQRREGDPVLSWATHEKYLSALTRFIEWAAQEDFLDKNYADGLKPLGVKPDASMAKLPFDSAELRRLFQRPIYTGCRDDERGFGRAGANIIRRSRYWAPLIALFSGLRAGEILQLTPDHFRVSPAGNPFIVLTPDMKLKNDNAQREIPLHQALIEVGLVQWVERRRSRGACNVLFPEVPKDIYDAESPIFSKRFRSDLKHLELGERRKKLTFHSFRHTFKQALDLADVPEQPKDELCGWARGKKTGRRYGSGLNADVLKSYLDRVDYDLDLTHLRSHASLAD